MSKNITSKTFRKEVIENEQLALVQFRTKWNGACQIMEPVNDGLELKFKDIVKFYSVDIEMQDSLRKEYGITDIPTTLFFMNGNIIDHVRGLAGKDIFISKIEQTIQTYHSLQTINSEL